MLEKNKKLIREFNQIVLVEGDMKALGEFLAFDFIDHSDRSIFLNWHKSPKMNLQHFYRPSFSNVKVQILEMNADEDTIVTRKIYTGTHIGPYLGIPATYKTVSLKLIDILKIKDRKFTDYWCNADIPGLLRQIVNPALPTDLNEAKLSLPVDL